MSNLRATVSKILNFSCVDGPGNRLVIFLQGCNFNCQSCHNPHTIDLCDHCGDCVEGCPENALSMQNGKIVWDKTLCTQCDECLKNCSRQSTPKTESYTVEEMLTLIRKHNPFLSGVTVTGGEATLQARFIAELFSAIKQDKVLSHLSCMVDSNGFLSETGWQKLLPVTDGTMIDLKAWQQDTHLRLTGRDNHRVMQSIQLLASLDKLYELRLLLIPGQTDLETEVDALANFLTQLPPEVRIKLNAFQTHGVTGTASDWPTCSKEQIEGFAEKLSQRGISNLVLPTVYL